MLSVENLQVSVEDKKLILQGLNLNVKPGEVHAVMGPNGSGKSTFAKTLAGHDSIQVNAGKVSYFGEDLLAFSPEERARKGVFLAFQYPVEIPGVNNAYFLRTALNCVRKANNQPEIDAFDFMQLAKSKLADLGMDEHFLGRAVNQGFSGGEKKRNEVLQMLLLQPKLAVLDETDSGLDIDALQAVAKGVNTLRNAERSFIVVTHYQRLLDYIVPDFVHVLADGKIVKSGGKELAKNLEAQGYVGISG